MWVAYSNAMRTMAKEITPCDQCGQYGAEWRELPEEGPGEGVMLCDPCWQRAQAAELEEMHAATAWGTFPGEE